LERTKDRWRRKQEKNEELQRWLEDVWT
jgi:hypothetical protein